MCQAPHSSQTYGRIFVPPLLAAFLAHLAAWRRSE